MFIARRDGEVLEAAAQPGGTARVLAAPDRFLFAAHQRRAADRAGRRHHPGLRLVGARRPPLRQRHHDLGDDVARLLDQDVVACADVLARDFLRVVQRRLGYRRAGEEDRLEVGIRRHRAGTADVDEDRLELGRRLLRRELVGERPARELRRRAGLLTPRDVVQLDDDAVGLERQGVPRVDPLAAEGDHGVDALAAAPVRLHRQRPARERLERGAVRRQPLLRRRVRVDQLIDERAEAARGDQLRIERPHRARGRVAGVGEQRLVGLLALAVDARERRARKEDLAAHFDGAAGAAAGQRQRQGADGADVGRDVLALDAVAAGDAADQRAGRVVGQRDAQAVDLQLGDVRQRLVAGAERPAQPLVEGARIRLVVGVVEAEHRHAVPRRGQAFEDGAADALGRRIGRDQLGMRRSRGPAAPAGARRTRRRQISGASRT